MAKAKVYADRTLETRLREAGVPVNLMWEVAGPKHTMIKWLSCYLVNNCLVMVQTYEEGGWQEFVAGKRNNIDATVAEVLDRTANTGKAMYDAVQKNV